MLDQDWTESTRTVTYDDAHVTEIDRNHARAIVKQYADEIDRLQGLLDATWRREQMIGDRE